MLRQLSVFAALTMFATGSVNAQEQYAALHKVEVPGATFDILVAMPRSAGAAYHLGDSPDALVVHLVGGELALEFESTSTMLQALASLRHPACSLHAVANAGRSQVPVAIYLAPKEE